MRKLMIININGLNSISFYVLGISCRQHQTLLCGPGMKCAQSIYHPSQIYVEYILYICICNMRFYEDEIRFTLCMCAECTYLSVKHDGNLKIEGTNIRKPMRYDRISSHFSLQMKSRDTAFSYSMAHYDYVRKSSMRETLWIKRPNGISGLDQCTPE